MALSSVFYDGVVTEGDRARHGAGTPNYGVYGPDDFRVVAHPTIPYAVLVKAGRAHGHRVTDTAASDQVVQCTAPGAGVVRWDLVVVRRNWQPLPGGTSTLVPVSAGTTARIPTTLNKNPGVLDDQPIFLVKWVGGTSAPTQLIDLRCWAAPGGTVIVDLLARGYLGEPGAAVTLDRTTWQYLPASNGQWDWVDMTGTSSSSANTIMRRDASNTTAVGSALLTAAQGSDARAATRKDYVDAQVAKLVTTSVAGAMSAADKKKVDAATSLNNASTVMMRDGSGRARVNDPSSTLDIANKRYVDAGPAVSAYGFVQLAGWSLRGACRVQQMGGSLKRVDMALTIQRRDGNVTFTNTYLTFNGVISYNARGAKDDAVHYIPITISGGSGNNSGVYSGFVNTENGDIGLRAPTSAVWTAWAQATINLTYYI